MPQDKFDLKPILRELKRRSRKLPKILGVKAKNHFRKSFVDGGFTDNGLEKWLEVKRRQKSSGWYGKEVRKEGDKYKLFKSPAAKTRAILVGKGGGTLKRSVKVIKSGWDHVVVGTRGVKYAEIHNEGLKGKVFGKNEFTMPKRQFIGNSRKLERELERVVIRELDKIFKKHG